jgi:HEAT repeat protein
MRMTQRNQGWLLALLVLAGIGCNGDQLNTSGNSNDSERLQTRMREVLLAAAADPEASLRCNALESLALLKPDAKVQKLVLKALQDELPAVRFAAVVAVGDMKYTPARRPLEQLLWDQDESVKMAAGYALEKLGNTRFKKWYDAALFGKNPLLKAQACMLLGKLGQTTLRADSRAKLWQVLRRPGQNPIVKLQAAEALAKLGDDKVLTKLLAFSSSGYADDRLMAISGLEYLASENTYAMLVTLADDAQLEVQLGAIRALGARATEEDLALVRRSLRHTDPGGDATVTARVRGLAALALGKTGQENDAKLLLQAMSDLSPYVQVAAARATIDYLKRRGNLETNPKPS